MLETYLHLGDALQEMQELHKAPDASGDMFRFLTLKKAHVPVWVVHMCELQCKTYAQFGLVNDVNCGRF